jgi:hypothetical protein
VSPQGLPEKLPSFLLQEIGFLAWVYFRSIRRCEFVMVAVSGMVANPVESLVMGDAKEPSLESSGMYLFNQYMIASLHYHSPGCRWLKTLYL